MTEKIKADKELSSINSGLAEQIQEALGENVFLCYQCVKCTSGCPISDYFDWQPNQIMRAAQLGQEEIVFNAETPWLCASCQTCTTRCPQDLDIAGIMDFITREAKDRGYKPSRSEVDIFNQAFMREIKLWGRAYELGLMAEMKLRTLNITEDLDLGAKMFAKNKMPFFPSPTRPPKKIKRIPGAKEKIAYYPGCSLHSTSREFNTSTLAATKALDLELVEPDGWICCGSSAAHRADPDEALRLPMVNLAIIEKSGFEKVVMPCAACFNRHKFAQYEIRHSKEHKKKADEAIGYEYQDKVQVNTIIDTVLNHVEENRIKDNVTNPLKGLKVVSYYGCLLTRPPDVTEAENPENPTGMDKLLSYLGAEVIDWSYKTTCCGASHSLTRPDIVLDLGSNIIQHAKEAGADFISVACPLCHTNLDARQFQMKLDQPVPVMFITQLMGLAFGLPAKSLALNKNLVDPRPSLKTLNLFE
jgi:heterodisulfide reductase subunit B